jgi:esterase/lipase
MPRTFTQGDLAVNEASYQRCVRGFAFLEKRLGLNIRLHAKPGAIEDGQIILFNHFARFETIVPQYLIHQKTGAYCRTLASGEFFRGTGSVPKFLLGIGGVPNDLDGLLPYMAAEILRGRKVVVFPEGGMIKDKRVVDEKGEYGIFSPSARAWRKHHKGAAAIAVMLDIFKQRILSVRQSGDEARLTRWAQALGIDSVAALLAAAEKPTLIVPGNITFSPLRVEENILKRSAEMFFKRLRDQAKEELLIEGNMLLRDTDMDIRLGAPVSPHTAWHWAERKFLDWSFERVNDLEHLFDLNASPDKWIDRLANNLVVRNTRRLRDQCTKQIYRQVTVNLSHLAAHLMFRLVARGVTEIDRGAFRRALYLAIKFAQQDASIFLHPALTDPARYDGLHTGDCAELDRFIALAASAGLVTDEDGKSRFLARISEDQDFHNVRLRNPVQVYANEIAAVPAACAAVARGLEQSEQLDPAAFARLRLDDEIRALAASRTRYAEPCHAGINDQATMTANAEPYLFLPSQAKKLGVVLVHGLLASPAELRSFGEALRGKGFPVIGVRLAGHGTSPWDLRDRSWHDWMNSVRSGYRCLAPLVEDICLVGFSLGGVLALRLAAEGPSGLAGVASVAAPIKLRNRNLGFIPMVHGANKLVERTNFKEGLMPFLLNESEHPEINYRHIPISAVYELRKAMGDLQRNLPGVTCPVSVIQGDSDHIVDPASARIIHDRVATARKQLHWIETDRHGILSDDIGGCQARLLAFVSSLEAAARDEKHAARKPLIRVSQEETGYAPSLGFQG